MTLSDFALLLDAPVDALRGPRPAEHVWHISVRNEPDDRVLSDAEWATVAEMVAAAGVAPTAMPRPAGGWRSVTRTTTSTWWRPSPARKAAPPPHPRRHPPQHTAARAFETAWDLQPMSLLDRTARRAPVTGEREKAARRGLTESARESPAHRL